MACYRCPITLLIMAEPVIDANGHTCERETIEQWFRGGHNTSPNTNEPLESQKLVLNHIVRTANVDYLNANPSSLDELYLPTKWKNDCISVIASGNVSAATAWLTRMSV